MEKEYSVNVRRIIREDTIVKVKAVSEEEVIELAKMDATSVEPEKWECYDCKYWIDDDAVKETA